MFRSITPSTVVVGHSITHFKNMHFSKKNLKTSKLKETQFLAVAANSSGSAHTDE